MTTSFHHLSGNLFDLPGIGKTYERDGEIEDYCRDLTEKGNSSLAEYRLDPVSLDLLPEMLEPDLDVNEVMANLSSKYSISLSDTSVLFSVE